MSAPGIFAHNGADCVLSLGNLVETAINRIPIKANAIPLKGFTDNHARVLTDRKGSASRIPIKRFDGRTPNTNATMTAKYPCQNTANGRHAFANSVKLDSNCSGVGVKPFTIFTNLSSDADRRRCLP